MIRAPGSVQVREAAYRWARRGRRRMTWERGSRRRRRHREGVMRRTVGFVCRTSGFGHCVPVALLLAGREFSALQRLRAAPRRGTLGVERTERTGAAPRRGTLAAVWMLVGLVGRRLGSVGRKGAGALGARGLRPRTRLSGTVRAAFALRGPIRVGAGRGCAG